MAKTSQYFGECNAKLKELYGTGLHTTVLHTKINT